MGEAIVKRLREAGATVMTTARSKPANLDLPDLFIEADISTRDGVQKVVDGVLARLGGIQSEGSEHLHQDHHAGHDGRRAIGMKSFHVSAL